MGKIIELENNQRLLKFAVEHDMFNLAYVREQMDMSIRKELLSKHTFKIWQGKDGKWYTYLPDKDKGRILRKKTQLSDLKEEIIAYYKQEIENPTIQEVFSEWNDRQLELKKISNPTHLRNEQIFKRHYGDFGKERIKDIETVDFEEFLEEQIPKYNLTSKAFSNLKTVTRGFLKRAKKRKLISFTPDEVFQNLDTSESYFKKTIKEDYEEVFSEEETALVMEYLLDHMDSSNIGIILMFLTGVRVGELVTLKHMDFDAFSFKVRRTETRHSIGDKNIYAVKEFPKTSAGVRTVVIPEDFLWITQKLKELNPSGEYIFLKRDGERMTTNCIRRRLERICRKLNIYPKSPHKIRKTYGSILLDNKVDKRLIMDQMGHTDISCTENHYHRNRKSLNKKSDIISQIPDFCMKTQAERKII